MEVGSVVGVIGFGLVVLLVLGVWKGKVKKVFDGLGKGTRVHLTYSTIYLKSSRLL